jgi:alkyl sulfatase BDS1-like metallo-beta-lactamase superfamily hydrolase
VLVHRRAAADGADVVLRLPSAALVGLLAGQTEGVGIEGDPSVLGRLMAVLDEPDPDFAIVTP